MMKKKSGKRFLSWLLAAVMIIALMPANAFANDDNDYGGIDTYANQSNDLVHQNSTLSLLMWSSGVPTPELM